MKLVARDSDILVKLQPLILPVFEQLHPLLGPAKIFQLHLLELAGAEGEVAWINFVAKRFPDLGDAERQFLARHFEDIFELNEDCLRCFRTKISHRRFVLGRAHVGLEHQVKRARLSQIFATAIRALPPFSLVDQLIGAQACLARSTIDHRIAEGVFVSARFPNRAVH